MPKTTAETPLLEFATFLSVGAIATLTHYGCALIAVERLGLGIYWGNLSGYVCAVGISYLGHSLLTFKRALAPVVLLRFVIASLTTLALSQLVLFVADTYLLLPPRLSVAVAVLYTVVQSYAINKYWVYRSESEI